MRWLAVSLIAFTGCSGALSSGPSPQERLAVEHQRAFVATVLALGKPYELIEEQLDDDYNGPVRSEPEPVAESPQWLTDYNAACNLARETGRKVLCVMTPDYFECGPCEKLITKLRFDVERWVAVKREMSKAWADRPNFPGFPVVVLIEPSDEAGQVVRLYMGTGGDATADNLNPLIEAYE